MGMDLEQASEYVRKYFFPRWDKKRQWVIKEVPDFPSFGLCDKKTKTISIGGWYISTANDQSLLKLLIHEVAHASTGANHGKKWLNRMQKAAETAKKLGHEQLTKILYEEIENYAPDKVLTVNATMIYDAIEDFVMNPDNYAVTFDDTIKKVAISFGNYPEELVESYKLCKKVYEEAIKMRRT